MKQFGFNGWNDADIAMNVMAGGGEWFDDVGLTLVEGRQVLCMGNPQSVGARVKMVDTYFAYGQHDGEKVPDTTHQQERCARRVASRIASPVR